MQMNLNKNNMLSRYGDEKPSDDHIAMPMLMSYNQNFSPTPAQLWQLVEEIMWQIPRNQNINKKLSWMELQFVFNVFISV